MVGVCVGYWQGYKWFCGCRYGWVYGLIQCGKCILQSLAKNDINPKVIKCMKIPHIRPKCHTNTYGS